MSKVRLAVALSALAVATVVWAVPFSGSAHQRVKRAATSDGAPVPLAPIRLSEDMDRGLLTRGWVNGTGPFVFAIDTGAGVSIISRKVVVQSKLKVRTSSRHLVGGLTTAPIASNHEAYISDFALGSRDNVLPAKVVAAVVPNLPSSIDGILDPTEVLSPFGYSVDLPNQQLLVFDARSRGLRLTDKPKEGAVVPWVRERGSHRPFVKLGDGRLALIDTGSGFGLALNGKSLSTSQRHPPSEESADLGGGKVQSRKVRPETVSIGTLVLKSVPTDVLTEVASNTPIILGRRALFPFRITFDPVAQLIAFEPTERN